MKPDAALLRILYDPVDWVDPQWLARFNIDLRWHRRLGNALLLQRAGLRPVTVADLGAPGVPWLVQQWDALSEAVYLVGARLARNALIKTNAVLHLRHNAYGFVTYPLSESLWGKVFLFSNGTAVEWPRGELDTRIFALGMSCLQKALPDLPLGWSDRLRMKLPPEVQPCASVERGEVAFPASASCLRLFSHAIIFYHAQRD